MAMTAPSDTPRPRMRQVYLDYAATTPPDPAVVARMLQCLSVEGHFANPSSASHASGRAAQAQVDLARAQVAKVVNCQPREIVWTSGATESDNLAIAGSARFHGERRRHIVTSRTEHKAVLDTCRALAQEGFQITYLTPARDGLIRPQAVLDALRADTLLVSVMQVNSETGVVQDIDAIAEALADAPLGQGVLLHVDAAQSIGRLAVDLARSHVDLMSFSAHKAHGPKGVGALFVRARPPALLAPLQHGGGQERGLRSGTLATHQIVGMAEAFMLAEQAREAEQARLAGLGARLRDGLAGLGGIHLNGHPSARVAGIVNVSVDGVEGESLLLALRALAVASGSACNSASGEPSYVLRALGRSDQQAQSSLRFSFGRFTNQAEIDFALTQLAHHIPRLRRLAGAGDSGGGAVGAVASGVVSEAPAGDTWEDAPGSMAYPEQVLRRFDAPAHARAPAAGSTPIWGQAGSAERGCHVQFAVVVRDGCIEDVVFRALGCPYTIAAAQRVCELAMGQPLVQSSPDAHALQAYLQAPVTRLGRLLVVQDAWTNCIQGLE